MPPHSAARKRKTESPDPIPFRNLADVMLAGLIIVTSMHVLEDFGVIELIGCRRGAGKLWTAVMGVPSSFLTLTYIVGIASSWAFVRTREVSVSFRVLTRFGGMASAIHFVFLSFSAEFCLYSSVVCVLFLVFWYAVERSHTSPKLDYVTPVSMFAASVLVGSFLFMAVVETDRARLDQELVRGSALRGSELEHLTTSEAETLSLDSADPSESDAPTTTGLSRLLFGQADAAVKVVAYYDYQSEACRRIDTNLRSLFGEHSDKMSLTIRHFPLCSECNLSISQTLNPDSCRLARAVEAAFLLEGTEGFRQMHQWILAQTGRITDEAIMNTFCKIKGSDGQEFIKAMNNKEVLAAVLNDVVEADVSGVSTSPTLFMNGQRLFGLVPETELKQILVSASLQSAAPTPTTEELQPLANAFITNDVFPADVQLAALLSTVRIHNSSQRTTGTGVIIASKGPFVFVLTAEHVVGESRWVTTETFTSDSYPTPSSRITASVVARSADVDLAVVRYATSEAAPSLLPLADAQEEIGRDVFSVGCDQQGPPNCVADRISQSALVRRNPTSPTTKMWQVSSAPVVGRSGGPLVDHRGRLVGIASGMSEGKGYFCHVEEIHRFLERSGLNLMNLIGATDPK